MQKICLKFLLILSALVSFQVKGAVSITDPAYINNSCFFNQRTFHVNITSTVGITSFSLAPKVYFKLNSGAYTSTTGVLFGGNYKNGIWSFTMNYTLTSNDFVSLFVVAQDSSGALTSNPSPGFSGTDVNTVISYPTLPFTYFTSVLNGTYLVGATGTFKRLVDATIAYNTACSLTGPVTFVLTDSVYKPSTGELFPIVFGYRSDASTTNSLLIKPQAGKNVAIRSDTNAKSVIRFSNTNYFTLDGFNGTVNGITIYHDATNGWPIGGIHVAGKPTNFVGCKSGTIRNTNIRGAKMCSGIFIGEDATFPGGALHDNINIIANAVTVSTVGILAKGNVASFATWLNNLTISSNTVGPASTTPTINMIALNGIEIIGFRSSSILKNLVQNVIGSGIIATNSSTLAIAENTVRNVGDSLSNLASHAYGIALTDFTQFCDAKGNFITNIKKHTSGYGAVGFYNGGSYNYVTALHNNMISDIVSVKSNTLYSTWPTGIMLESTSYCRLVHNSVSLYGSHASNSGNMASAALLMTRVPSASGVTTTWKNNILSNTYDHSGSSADTSYAVYAHPTAGNSYTLCDYNSYNVGGPGSIGMLGKHNKIDLPTLSAMKTAFGDHYNCNIAAPIFITPNDLHLVIFSNPAMDNTGGADANFPDDFDNLLRSTTYPDIGADEFTNTSPCISALYGKILVDTISLCEGTSDTLNFGGPSSGTGYTYQWKVSTTSSGPYSNVVGGSGATTMSYITPTLNVGTFYYVLEKTCTSASLSAISGEATVTVRQTPSITATATNTLLCPKEKIYLFGTASTPAWNTYYYWTGPSSFTSWNQNTNHTPSTSSGNYYFTATYNGCTSPPMAVSYSVHPTYSAAISVSPSTLICLGSSATLAASGGSITSFSWWPLAPVGVTTVVVTPSTSGNFNLYHTDINSCTYTTSTYIDVSKVWINSSPMTLITCAGSGQSFTLNVWPPANSYTWSSGQSTQFVTVTPTVTTTYSAAVTTTASCPYTAVTTITVSTCTGISENEKKSNQPVIIPNPNNGEFELLLPNEFDRGLIKIYNVLGQLIHTERIVSKTTKIILLDISSGLYYLKVELNGQKTYLEKFIIDRTN